MAESMRIGQAAEGKDFSAGLQHFQDRSVFYATGQDVAGERKQAEIDENWEAAKSRRKRKGKGKRA